MRDAASDGAGGAGAPAARLLPPAGPHGWSAALTACAILGVAAAAAAVSALGALALAADEPSHAPTPRVLRRYSLAPLDPLATCNDGSAAQYYYSAASSAAGARVWIIHQEGGGWCWDAPSCAKRVRESPARTASASYAPTHTAPPGSVLNVPAGISAPLAGAHVLYLRYCTSDGYVGDAPPSASSGGLAFRGRRVVAAAIDALGARHGLANATDATVVYSGCSAGARGVLHNLDRVADHVARIAGPGARTVGVVDSGLYVDLEPIPGAPMPSVAAQARAIVSRGASVDERCAATYPSDTYKCLIGEYALRTLRSPAALLAFQFDSYQLELLLGGRVADAPKLARHADWAALVRKFRARTVGALRDGGGAPTAALSPACYAHCVTDTAAFSYGYTVDATSLAARVQSLAFGAPPPSPIAQLPPLIEECEGFACGTACDAAVGGGGDVATDAAAVGGAAFELLAAA